MININEALKLKSNHQIDQEIKEREKLLDQMIGSLYPNILINEINQLDTLRESCQSCRKNPKNYIIEIDDLGEFQFCKECMDKGITFCIESVLTKEQNEKTTFISIISSPSTTKN